MADLSSLGIFFGIVGILAASFAVVRSSNVKVLVDAQEKLIHTLQGETSTQAMIISTCKERLQAAETTINVLKDQVTGTTAIAHLTTLVIEQHAQLLEELKR